MFCFLDAAVGKGMPVSVRAIQGSDLPAVGQFLHAHLNPRISAQTWASAPLVPWQVSAPNHGFLLADRDEIVGVYLAFYSIRSIDGIDEPFCNLGAWCVRHEYRGHSMRLLKAMLGQKGYTLTDLSPSGAVISLNERLGFQHLNTATVLIPALPLPIWPSRIRISVDPTEIERALTGKQLQVYRDHAHTAAAHHLLLTRGHETCYVIYRRDRRKNLPVFASILYVGDPGLFTIGSSHMSRYLLFRHGILAMLAEVRTIIHRPKLSLTLASPRRKMFKSERLRAEQIDDLYSELVCVAW
jgi:hypothetical protein